MANRERDYQRMQRRKHIQRKRRIVHEQGDLWVYQHPGELSKNKIHCSCPLCRCKSYDEASIQDRKNKARLNTSLQDYFDQRTKSPF